ncbi:MAG TPA: hypothetical protein VME01_11330 [Solirubrobacteraceae bacterium]|nr:hypothetical protein [Solirubrobacteraceae bacterium]
MLSLNPRRTLDHSQFDRDHDLDLVALANNARTPEELAAVERLGHARLRARGAKQVNARRDPAARRGLRVLGRA